MPSRCVSVDTERTRLNVSVNGKSLNYLAEDLKFSFLLLVGRQSCKLLQQDGRRWSGDVQEVLEGLVDGAGRDPSLVRPVTDHTCTQ